MTRTTIIVVLVYYSCSCEVVLVYNSTMEVRSSASTMYVINNIDSLEVLVRKRIFGFMERLNNSDNTIIKCINNSWILRFDIWSPWNELLFIH